MNNLVILGAGGFAREVAFLIADVNRLKPEWNLLGFLDVEAASVGTKVGPYSVVGTDDFLEAYSGELHVVIGIGIPQTIRRLAEQVRSAKHLRFPNLIHPSVIMDRERVSFGQGNIACAGTIFTTDIEIGSFNIINLGCTIGHDCQIGSYNVINPGTNISGGVTIADACLLGTGATILQYKKIADAAIVGAGSVVMQNVGPGLTVLGLPAKPLQKLSNT
jgi:sugar O-acyltransferase (sialic acid O-acetyltransferase NeuD family)